VGSFFEVLWFGFVGFVTFVGHFRRTSPSFMAGFKQAKTIAK
jgi:hypothetical protein